MAKVFFNQDFNNWSASNGATRRTLKVVSKLTTINEDLSIPICCSLGTLDKGNHSFIFVNEPKSNSDNRILGVFLNTSYGYSVHKGKELYSNNSVGGVGNSESKFGIYEVGTILEIDTYKNRQSASYMQLTENGWIEIEIENNFESQQTQI
jgi:hypothetical protein